MKRHTKIAVLAAMAVITLLVSAAWAGSRSLAWLGVVTQEVDRDIADEFNLKSRSGAIIDEVIDDSPAEKAGLKEDDIIIAFNDDKVRDDDDLTDLVQDSRPGDSVTLTLIRDGAEKKIPVKLGRRSSSRSWFSDWDYHDAPYERTVLRIPAIPAPPAVPDVPKYYSYHYDDYVYIGVSLIELSDETAQALGASKGGVLIDEVEPDSPAEAAGIKPGDILAQLGNEAVFEAQDVQEIVRDLDEGDTLVVSLVRDRKPLTLKVVVEYYEDRGSHRRHGSIVIPNVAGFAVGSNDAWTSDYTQAMKENRVASSDYRDEMRALQRDLKKMKEDLGGTKKYRH